MATGNAVERKACRRTICLTHFYPGSKSSFCLPAADFHPQLIRQRNESGYKALQFSGNRAAVQIELQQKRPLHSAEYGIQLLPHLFCEHLADILRPMGIGSDSGFLPLYRRRIRAQTCPSV